ncbi:transposase, MuDR, MULE transposase domain protein [Tanacetum coccineum]
MSSNLKNFKCLIHFNETQRGSILSEYLTYSMLHEMVMQKFKLEANAVINLSFKLSSFDFAVDITDDAEVKNFVECACNSNDEFAHLFVAEQKNNQKNMFFNFFESPTLENEGPSNQEIPSSHLNNSYNKTSFLNNGLSVDLGQNDFHMNDSLHLQNEPHFSNPESSFDFRSNEYNTDDVVNENPQNEIHKWQKFMSFEPDIPEAPVYKAKPIISKQYSQQSQVEKGNIFYNKESLILAVRLKALSEVFQYLTDISDSERCYLKCYNFAECDWYLRATLWDNTKKFYITYLNDVHTCSKTQTYPNHRNANKKVIDHLLTLKLQDRSRVLRGKDIQQDILSEYKIHISYQQAMKGKHCGTVTRIKTDDNRVFEMLFIAIGASIRTFLNYLRPMLMIDAAHLKGLYKGTNLVAVAMDGNNQIVPIAFGICKGETGPCWSWWMSVLKECIGDNTNLLFISDRHAVIALAVEKEFPLAFHAVCCRHLMMNLGLKNKNRKGLFWKICKAYTREDYATSMNTLQIVQPDAHEKLCRVGPQRWSRAHCPLVRYNYMTSNSVESVNACSVIYRKEPVLKLAETYRAMVQEWYYKRRQLAANMTYEITDWAAHKVAKKKMKSATWVVKGVNAYQYEVSDGQYIREVNLQTGICGCRKWQLSGLPCGHVIAITRFLGLTDCVHYVADWFKKPKYQATYSESIHSLGNMQQWEFPENIQKAIPPRMDNPQPGRPKNTKRIQSQGEEPRIIRCTRCTQTGHRRDQCGQPFVVQPPVNIRGCKLGSVIVMIGRVWDVTATTSRYLSKDFVVSDSKDEFRVFKDDMVMLEFDGATIVRKASVSGDGFLRYVFHLVEFDDIELTNNKYFIDVAGYVTNVGRSSYTKGGSKTLEFYLANPKGQSLRVTLWGSVGDSLIEKKTTHPGVCIVFLCCLHNVCRDLQQNCRPMTYELNKEVMVVDSSRPREGTIKNLFLWARNRKNDVTTFSPICTQCWVASKRAAGNYPSCGGEKCRKRLSMDNGTFKCGTCGKIVDYPVLRYRLEVVVADDTAHTVVVLFNEMKTVWLMFANSITLP